MPEDSSNEARAAGAAESAPAGGKTRAKARKRLLLFFLLGGGLIVLLVLGWWLFFARGIVSTDDAFIDARVVNIAPQVSGRLVEVPVDSDTQVKTGDVLARIDRAGPEADFAQAKASVATAQAQVASAQAQVTQSQAAAREAESARTAAQVTAENARRTADRLARIRTNSANSAVSQQDLDDAEAEARSAEAQAEEAATAVEEAQAAVTAAQASVKTAEAQVAEAQASQAAAQVVLDQLTVTAPADGQVVQVSVDKGSYVAAGGTMMAFVPDAVYVTANFKETQIARIRPGQTVEVSVDAYPDTTFHGHVLSIQRGAGQAFQLLPAQNATGNFVKVVQRVPVRISIEDARPDRYVLGPGMSVVPRVDLNSLSEDDSAGQVK